MSSPADSRTASGPTVASRRWWTRCALWMGGPLLVLLAVLFSAWLALHWAILPHIDDWRPNLEKQATQALGVPVRIGSISASSGGWIPTLDLRDVRLTDARGRDALVLPRVSASLSARSLLALELRFSQLLLDGPELLLRRDTQGRVFVAGLSMDGHEDTPTSEAAADWFFQQHEFVILHGRIRWVDELRAAPPLELFDLNLVLRNGLRRHQLRVDATPPTGWGERFSLRGQFTQSLLERPGALQHWSGQLFADLPRTDVRELRRYLDLPFELNEGDGALRAWLDIEQGQPRNLTLDMGLRAVKLRVSPTLPELDLAQVGGRLVMQQTAKRFSLEAKQLGFRAGDGLDWPRSDWALHLQRNEKTGTVTGGDFQAQQLDLALGAQILSRLPLAESQRELIGDMKPGGALNGLQLQWEGPLEAPHHYRAKGQLQQLQLTAAAPVIPDDPASAPPIGRPGVRGAEVQFDANEQGGSATLAINNGQLTLPGVFTEAALPVQQAQATLNWRAQRLPTATSAVPTAAARSPLTQSGPSSVGAPASAPGTAPITRQWTVQFSQVKLVTDDLRAEVDGVWQSALTRRPHDSGRLDLTGRIDEVRAPRVLRYLPASLGPDARRYIRDAIQDGTVQKIQVRLLGDLIDFPFDAPRSKGQFHISSQVRDLTLAYVPSHPAENGLPAFTSPWPAMEQLHAELVFDRAAMTIRNGRARLMGVELTDVQGHMADLYHHAPVLDISGDGRGALADALRYVRSSPVSELTSHVLDPTVANGPMTLKLGLRLPLAHIDGTTVKGQVMLTGNDLRLSPDAPMFTQTRARIDFDQKGLQIRSGQARVLGGDTTFDGGTQADGSLRFIANGTVTAEAMRNAPELGLGARAAQAMTGQTPVRFELGILKGQPEITLTSTMQGMGLDLPAPLRKTPEESWPLRVTTRALPAPTGSQREELRIEAGPVQALYQRDVTGEPRVLRGALALQEKLPELPTQGVVARATFQQLNADTWQTALPALMGSKDKDKEKDKEKDKDATREAPADSDAALDGAIEGGYAPSQLALKVQTLQASGRTLNRVVAGVTRDSATAGWRVSVDAEQLSGFIEVRTARPHRPGRVFARLSRLSVPKTDADTVEQLLDQQPHSVPTLDIVVDDFELRGKRLGRLEIEAQQQAEVRDWKLNKLLLKNPDATLSAAGQWAPEAGRSTRRTELDWKLDVVDAGKLLERLGQGQVLRGGKGQLTGQLGWQGSPMSPDYPSMRGKLAVAMDSGQFLKAEPGVGRLLGVLSLQSIPRRLVLDFRDVFSEGFAFDNVGGDIQIAKGVARSDNLRMRGLQAAVLMEGSANLAAETQDLHVVVVPEINAGGAALAYAAVNPAIGLGTFLAQWLLRKPIVAASTEEFRVTGTWTDPKIEQVPRGSQPSGSQAPDTATGQGDSAP
ncbi:YhdP family protein [Roseateles amylovorans]|uniref:YhdP family protein n=1 Tax=Roseateles amylovorans TaxID=2978473 RepID=A0ABY6B405_9BURK|nr:YhdP family protein [Roseateles amylovorans]UXH78005.1 YhdP family protein [Roseateles amylovorans]